MHTTIVILLFILLAEALCVAKLIYNIKKAEKEIVQMKAEFKETMEKIIEDLRREIDEHN